jgi:hypothetical protein
MASPQLLRSLTENSYQLVKQKYMKCSWIIEAVCLSLRNRRLSLCAVICLLQRELCVKGNRSPVG